MNVGLYFGSFNPVHVGHLIIANFIAQNTYVDEVWLIVSPQNPFKQPNSLLNEYHRFHLVQLSIIDNPLLKTSDIEFKLPRPSYTVNTLTHLSEKYPLHIFSIIIGSDSHLNFNKWKNADFIKSNYRIIVYERPGFVFSEEISNPIKPPLLDISSTMIRTLIKKKQSIRYLVPEKVEEEIVKCGYYK